jgi:hypothetical protein
MKEEKERRGGKNIHYKEKKYYKINNRHYLHIMIFIGYIWKAEVQTWFKIWIEVSNWKKNQKRKVKRKEIGQN